MVVKYSYLLTNVSCMKTQNRNYYLTLTGLFFLITACDNHFHDCIRGNGPNVRVERNVTGFNSVYNGISANVHIAQGEPYQVTIEGREDVVDEIRTTVDGDALSIESRYCLKGGDVDIFITIPAIRSIANLGSGSIFSDNIWESDDLNMSITGSGDIKADMEVGNLEYKITGSGNVRLTGKRTFQDIRISGSGRVNSFGLRSDEAYVSISGSGRCEVTVEQKLDVKISGSGSVFYRGNPSVSSAISGSGRIFEDN